MSGDSSSGDGLEGDILLYDNSLDDSSPGDSSSYGISSDDGSSDDGSSYDSSSDDGSSDDSSSDDGSSDDSLPMNGDSGDPSPPLLPVMQRSERKLGMLPARWMMKVSYKHLAGAFIAAALGGTPDAVMQRPTPVQFVLEKLYPTYGSGAPSITAADLAAKLRTQLRVDSLKTGAFMLPMNAANMYHFSSERAPSVHA